MAYKYNKIALIGTHYFDKVILTVADINKKLLLLGFKVYVDEKTAKDLNPKDEKYILTIEEMAKQCDIAIVVGGDGNFLHASRALTMYGDIPIVGINRGKLGFLTEFNPDEKQFYNSLLNVLKGNHIITEAFMLDGHINDIDAKENNTVALNEISVTALNGKMFGIRVYIDNHYAFEQRGDGLIISTPTGSTGHAMSAGGPILSSSLNNISLVPICPHSLSSRPLVISSDSNIDIEITDYNNANASLNFDGKYSYTLKAGSKINIKKYHTGVKIVHSIGYNYYDTLREKLGWGRLLF